KQNTLSEGRRDWFVRGGKGSIGQPQISRIDTFGQAVQPSLSQATSLSCAAEFSHPPLPVRKQRGSSREHPRHGPERRSTQTKAASFPFRSETSDSNGCGPSQQPLLE